MICKKINFKFYQKNTLILTSLRLEIVFSVSYEAFGILLQSNVSRVIFKLLINIRGMEGGTYYATYKVAW